MCIQVSIVNSRYWSTETYQTKLFNDYICFNLKEGILKRVINNDTTGLIDFYTPMWKFWTLLVRFFGRMADFINFQGDDDEGDVIIDESDPETHTVSDNNLLMMRLR